jgi:hypothetical protein
MGFRINYCQSLSPEGMPYVWNYGFGAGIFGSTTTLVYDAGYFSNQRSFVLTKEPFTSARTGTQAYVQSPLQKFLNGFEGTPAGTYSKYYDRKFRENLNFFYHITRNNTYFPKTLTPPTNNVRYWFGYSIDARAGKIAVGAPKLAVSSFPKGTAYVYDLSGALKMTLTNVDATGTVKFNGSSVAISESGKIAVGAESVPGENRGIVTIWDPTTPYSEASPKYSILQGDSNSNLFGSSLQCFRNRLFVGIPGQSANTGQVNVYNIDTINSSGGSTTTPNEYVSSRIFTIAPSNLTNATVSEFGTALAVTDDLVAIGAPGYTEQGCRRGAVFLVNVYSGYFNLRRTIVKPGKIVQNSSLSYYEVNGTTVRLYGSGIHNYFPSNSLIEISGAQALNAPGDLSNLNGTWAITGSSSVGQYVEFSISNPILYNLNGSLATPPIYFYFSQPSRADTLGTVKVITSGTDFGSSIAIGSGRIVIGDWLSQSSGASSGEIHIYDMNGALISSRSHFFNADHSGVGQTGFGYSVAIGNGKIFVGSPGFNPFSFTNENSISYFYLITGGLTALNLDGGFISFGWPDDGLGGQYWSRNNNLWDGSFSSGGPQAGIGYRVATYNDALYATSIGISNTTGNDWENGIVLRYENLTRTYTPYDIVDMQKGSK